MTLVFAVEAVACHVPFRATIGSLHLKITFWSTEKMRCSKTAVCTEKHQVDLILNTGQPFILWTWLCLVTFVYWYYKQYDAKSAQMSGVHLFSATYWLWSMPLALPRHCHNYFQCIFMIQNGKWFSNAECICVVCVEVLRHSQQLRSCRAGQLPINAVPGQASTY